jgi:hypothetical protein
VVLGIPIDSARIDEPDADVAELVATRGAFGGRGAADRGRGEAATTDLDGDRSDWAAGLGGAEMAAED